MSGPARTLASGHGSSPERAGKALEQGLHHLVSTQLPTGELPGWRVDPLAPRAGRIPCANVLLSTLAHDTLAPFDPGSPWQDPRTLAPLPRAARMPWALRMRELRRRIRAFVAWQERGDGLWSFFGRTGGLPPDAPTTACAATTLLEGTGPGALRRTRVEALQRFASEAGPFHTFLTGPPELDALGNAHVLRYLALMGEDVSRLAAWVLDALHAAPAHTPPALCHAVAGAWRQAALPDLETVAEAVVERLGALRGEDGTWGSPLGTALATLALLDVGRGEAIPEAAVEALLAPLPIGAPLRDAYLLPLGLGSSALTAAFQVSALGRCAAEGLLPDDR